MSKRKFTEAEIIAAIHQVDAGRTCIEVGREVGVSKHTRYAWKAKDGGLGVLREREARLPALPGGRLGGEAKETQTGGCGASPTANAQAVG